MKNLKTVEPVENMSIPQNQLNVYLSDILWLILGIGLLYYGFLGSHPLFIPDEGRYAEIAREMVVTHDYITPRLNGVAFLDKPIFYYWLEASAIHWFGVKEWAIRFWPATLGLIGCLVTYIGTHFLFDRRTGLLASIILAANPLYYGAAHYANLDLEVAVFISTALLFALCGLQSSFSRQRTVFFCVAYAASGVAILTKGLIGLVFPLIIIGFWAILRRRWSILKEIRVMSGFVIISLIVIPWYYEVQLANPQFFHFFFITQQISRFLSHDVFNSQKPFLFFIPVLVGGFFPWSLFIYPALTNATRSIWFYPREHPKTLFLALWFWVVFLFFSFPHSKLIGYILPTLPPLSILIAYHISADWSVKSIVRTRRRVVLFATAFLALSTLCFAIPSFHIITDADTPLSQIHRLEWLGGIFMLGSLMMGVLYYFYNTPRLFYCLTAMGCLSIGLLFSSAAIINQKTIKPIALQIKPLLKPSDEVVSFYEQRYDLPLYLERRITMVADWHAKDIAEHDNGVRELWYGLPFQKKTPWLIEEEEFWKRWYSKKRLWVWVNIANYDHFIQKSGRRTYLVIRHGNTFVMSNHRIRASLLEYKQDAALPR